MTRFRIALLLIATAVVFTTAASAREVEFLIQSGHEAWMHGGHDLDQSALIARHGEHFAALVRDGHTYVITDPGVLAQLEQLYAPVANIARQQATLGSKQADLGRRQADVGAEQARIGAQQAAIALANDHAAERDLTAQQKQLNERQRELGDRQRVLNDEQRVLRDRQNEISRRSNAKIERILDDAIATGKARAD